MGQMPLFITAKVIEDAKREVLKDISLATKNDYIPGIKEFAEARIHNLKQYILDSKYLWDMENWNHYKDINEVRAWVRNPPNKNWQIDSWIQELKKAGVAMSEIVDLVMQNPHVSYNGNASELKSILKSSVINPPTRVSYSSDGSVKRKIKFKKAV